MTRLPLRAVLLIIAAVAVTAAATTIITTSLSSADPVLSADDVDRALAAVTASPTSPSPTATPTTTAGTATTTGDPGVLSTLTPGRVTVACDGSLATLVSWSPNPGWRADDPVQGPAAQVSVRFESDVAADYLVTATCVDGVPVAQEGPDTEDHGGHGGGGSGRG